MGGILCSGDSPGVEATGVYKGILMRDMIDCVNEFKKPFIDVYIESLFFKDADYPLTYVPAFNMVLPLKKDQEVWVYFNQDNHRYPVLWKLVDDVDEDYTKKFDLPKNGNLVTFPGAEDTKEVIKFSDSCWFIGTESYGVFHWGDQCVLLNDDSIIMNANKKLQYKSGGTVSIEAPDGVTIESSSGNISMKGTSLDLKASSGKLTLEGSSIDLGTVLHDVLNDLATISPTTQGTPAAQVFNPALISKLVEAVAKIAVAFKG